VEGPMPLSEFLRALPKVELHVHLVGSASVPTVLRLAARHGAGPVPTDAVPTDAVPTDAVPTDAVPTDAVPTDAVPTDPMPTEHVPTDPEQLAAFYAFRDFAHFVDVYQAVNALVSTPADVTDLVLGLARDLAAGTVRYAEVTVTPVSHLSVGIGAGALADALTEGRERARTEHGVELGWIFDTAGELGVDAAWATLDWVRAHRPAGTVGFGLGGPELGVDRAAFARPFAAARDAGLRSLPHAGETTGPATVWSALRDLGAERIGHGIGAVTDPALLDHLAEHRIPLEVCPTSNLRTGAVPSLAAHPLPRLLRGGVPVTLNTDDPGMFGCDIVGEYRLAHDVLGLARGELVALAGTAVDAASLPAERKRALHTELAAVARCD
jgi:aminodeoxyfutalosine deaminase